MARTQAGENGGALRALALAAVVIGLVAMTTAACVLSYSSVHDFALSAGIKPSLARIYPDIADAMLAMAGCSVLALRGAGLLSKVYAWLCFVVLLGALAATSAAREAGLSMPKRAAEITAAIFPWVLVLAAFGLLLALLRYARRRRQAQRASSAPAVLEPPVLEPPVLPALEAGESVAYEAAQEYDTGAYDSAGEYQASEPYEYVMLQPTSQYPASSPEEPGESDEQDAAPGVAAESGVVSPTVPLPRPAVEPDAEPDDTPEAQPPAQPPRAIRPTEMQLRARTSRQPEPADAEPTGTQAADQPNPPAGAQATEPVTSGFTGDTIPRGELNPAPTPATNPPELDRPRSSPTPPS